MRYLALFLVFLSACAPTPPGQTVLHATAALVVPSPGPTYVVVATAPPSPAPTSVATPLPEPSPAAPPTATPTELPSDPVQAHEAALAAAVNALRAQNGLAAYTLEPALSEVARLHSCDLAAHAIISHTSSDGRTLQERLGAEAERWIFPSESIAAGTDDPAQVIALWMDEPPDGWHRRNLLDPDQQVFGVGYCTVADDPSGNHYYWTMDIARPAS